MGTGTLRRIRRLPVVSSLYSPPGHPAASGGLPSRKMIEDSLVAVMDCSVRWRGGRGNRGQTKVLSGPRAGEWRPKRGRGVRRAAGLVEQVMMVPDGRKIAADHRSHHCKGWVSTRRADAAFSRHNAPR